MTTLLLCDACQSVIADTAHVEMNHYTIDQVFPGATGQVNRHYHTACFSTLLTAVSGLAKPAAPSAPPPTPVNPVI